MNPASRKYIRELVDSVRTAAGAAQAPPELSDQLLGPVLLFAIPQLAHALGELPTERSDGSLLGQLQPYRTILSSRFPFFEDRLVSYTSSLEGDVLENLLNQGVDRIAALEDYEAEILSWLYQYLKEEHERAAMTAAHKAGAKIRNRDLLFATQFFTEGYMVRYLVRTTLAPILQEPIPLQGLRILDPACGAGNFLMQALKMLYTRDEVSQDTRRRRIDTLLSTSLIGYDLDSDLAKVASVNLLLMATNLLGELPQASPLCFGGHSDQDETGFLDPGEVEPVLTALQGASRTVILTNPPFLGRRLMSPSLKDFLQERYPQSRGDLCTGFVLRCLELLDPGDYAGLVHQRSWMYLSSFKDLRREVLTHFHIEECVDLGSGAFADLNGEKANVALTVFSKPADPDQPSQFLRLVNLDLDEKRSLLDNNTVPQELVHRVTAQELLDLDQAAFHYYLPSRLRRTLKVLPRYGDYARPMQGTSTGNNDEFVRYSWQIHASNSEWRSTSKGGGYCKWAGLNQFLVLWGEDGERVRENPGSAIRNADRVDDTELGYSDTGTLGLSVRKLRPGQIFIASGPGIQVLAGQIYAHLAFLNSRLASYFIRLLSPKLSISPGYLARLPFPEAIKEDACLAALGLRCFKLKNALLRTKLTNDEFTYGDLFRGHDLDSWIESTILRDLRLEAERLRCEAEVEGRVCELFGLDSSDRRYLNAETGACAADLPAKDLAISSSTLDHLISDGLDSTCQFPSRRQQEGHLGCEGSVEAIAQRYQVSSDSVLATCRSGVTDLPLVKQAYFEDLLHKGVLYLLGFNADRTWEEKDLPLSAALSGLRDLIPINPCAVRIYTSYTDLPSWIQARLPDLHRSAFRGAPVISVGDSAISLRRSI